MSDYHKEYHSKIYFMSIKPVTLTMVDESYYCTRIATNLPTERIFFYLIFQLSFI